MKKLLLNIISAVGILGCIFSFTACGEKCRHAYDRNKWSYDETSHWHPSTCEHADLKDGNEEHDYENGVCKVCGYDRLGTEGLEYRAVDGGYCVTGAGNAVFTDGLLKIPANYDGKPVTEIAGNAFFGNENITRAVIPDGVKTIAGCAFQKCVNLKSVTFGKGITGIGEDAFADSGIENVVLPDGLTVLEANVFYQCYSLKRVDIGNGVSEIKNNVFYLCNSLESVTAGADNTVYASAGGVLYNKQKTEVVFVPKGLKNLIIPSELSIVPADVFDGKDALESVEIPAGIEEIQEGAFGFCPALKSVTLPKDIYIAKNAFVSCASLTQITYNGTLAEWNRLSKVQGWDTDSGEYTVHCTDGTVHKDGKTQQN